MKFTDFKKIFRIIFYKRNYVGFTVVELMLVVVLIGILSGLTLSIINPSSQRARARDSQRVADLKKIQTALELKFSDSRAYPVAGSWLVVNNSNLGNIVTDGYISALPADPKYSGTFSTCPSDANETVTYNYSYRSDGVSYVLVARMETGSFDYSKCSSLTKCTTYNCNCSARCHAVQNPF